jgi:hypothetical protein
MDILSWVAVVALAASYWFQIYRIHIHKEVRDLSTTYHVLLALGSSVLAVTALIDDSLIFLIKQLTTAIPALVILFQIRYHRDDHWHDDSDADCLGCEEELEPDWKACPYCARLINPGEERYEV